MTQLWATEGEINQQPEVWAKWADELGDQLPHLRQWISSCNADEIWLVGAGTSAFIGDAIAEYLSATTKVRVRAIPTTDLVSSPYLFTKHAHTPLVVSFGRSGNSSESVGVLDLLDHLLPEAHRLHITCACDSVLSTRVHPGPSKQRVITLPPATLDEGFAMTSSYSTMLLTALACFDPIPVEQFKTNMQVLAQAAKVVLSEPLPDQMPERAVFLGAGAFKGAAREAALKVLELTAGELVISWDSTLGFRHGPQAIVNDSTALFIALSADTHSCQYDTDIVAEIRRQFPKAIVTTLGTQKTQADISFAGTENDAWDVVLFVLWSQRLAVEWSKRLQLNVDNPFADGNLTRVVSGVTLYTDQLRRENA